MCLTGKITYTYVVDLQLLHIQNQSSEAKINKMELHQ